MDAIVKSIGNCKCELGPIVRYINFRVLEGCNTVFLDCYKDKLLCSKTINELNNCLKRHGFKGQVKFIDGFCIYGC